MDKNHTAPKRVLVTGGAGEMGAYACRILAQAEAVAQVVVADRDDEKAAKLAIDLGPFGGAQSFGPWMWPWAAAFTVLVGGAALAAFARKDL